MANPFKEGQPVRYKNETVLHLVYSLYDDEHVSLTLADYPDTEQDEMTHVSEIEPVKECYRLVDGEGGGLKWHELHPSLESVRESLAGFHSVDVEGAERMTLTDLCEIGTWSIVDQDDKEIELV